MVTFCLAYLLVWLAVVLYVMWLGAAQRRLTRSIESLRSHLEEPQSQQESPSKAA